jgi:putative membrane protein
MKKVLPLLIGLGLLSFACNNEANDSVDTADSANEAKQDNQTTPGFDQASSDFLVKAADGGMAEVEAGQLAQEKGTNAKVKSFASMMVSDHSGANSQVKSLAAARNISLPATVSDENKNKKDDLAKKTGADFDKAYMDLMVDDHQKTINLFENASGDVKDAEVKTFVDNTLPKLRMHLDSAKAIRDGLK